MKRTSARAPSLQDWPGTRYMDQAEIEAATRVLAAKSPFRYYGPDLQHETPLFEQQLAKLVGSRFCLGVASGSAALQVALAALGVGPGDEVIVPGYFWVSTVAAVVNNGAIPVLADVDETLSLDPADLERKINARTRAVIVVHMAGVIGQIERIAAICNQHSIPLLEDCAQSLGARKRGVSAGRFGAMAIFSFQLNKICTAGEGGAIVTDDGELYEKAVAIHDQGYPRDAAGMLVLDDDRYQHWGLGARMSELTAAILRVQLGKLPALADELRSLKLALVEILRPAARVKAIVGEDPTGDPGTVLTLLFEDGEALQRFQQRLFAAAMRVTERRLRTLPLAEYGLHLYYQNQSLVKKKSICGHHAVWDLAENAFAKHYSYGIGTLPVLDGIAKRALLFAIPAGMTPGEREDLRLIFQRTVSAL